LTYSISWDLQKAFRQNGDHFPASFLRELEQVIDPAKKYAVRSSANVEDSRSQTYAGQFLSVIEVSNLEEILNAIRAVWDSSHLEGPTTYRDQQGVDQDVIKMGVLIQEMVPALLSGVAFSCNPITGLDEVVVEAVEGSGVALMQDGVTPQRWIWKWGKWLQQPEDSDISLDLVQKIVEEVREISSCYRNPVDVEWAFDGQDVIWLQMRGISALQSIDIYANHLPKEFLPGVIKPLVWTVNVPLVNSAWVRLLTELIGKNQLDPLRLARSFYGYAYFNMGLLGSVFKKVGLPDNALERLMGFESEGDDGPNFKPTLKALRYLPRMIKFSLEKVWFGRKIKTYVTQAREKYAELEAQTRRDLTDSEWMDHIDQLYTLNQRTAYFNIVTPLLMRFYHQLAKRALARKGGIDYERYNWLSGWAGRADYDPMPHLYTLGTIYKNLDPEEIQGLKSGQEIGSKDAGQFQELLREFMEKFGHLSDNGNDFSYPLWGERPEMILRLVADFADNTSTQKKELNPLSPGDNTSRGWVMNRAAQYSRYREEISFLYIRGFSMFRQAYKNIGIHFTDRALLDDAEDIYYLEHDEIVSAIKQGECVEPFSEKVRKRKEDARTFEAITPPPVIYGNHPPPILDNVTTILTGIPTSRGIHRGVVQVVKGISDFHKVTEGCVLVIPYSDVSLTPLFTRAGALVAEAGGLLSHSSIVARELGIPAIVSVPHATQLKSGIEVTVNGYTGNIILHNQTLAEEELL
jgi:phosphohistidine swiveling domain-containing protein